MEFTKKYNPDRSPEWNYGGAKWRLSRSKIDLFIECPRCFYLDNKLGTKRPSMPSFNLNIAVDELFKKEFDVHRKQQTAHPIMTKYQIDAVPLKHKSMDEWRDPFVGITYKHAKTGLLVCGGVDDLWQTPDGKIIVVDFKATSKADRIEKLGDSPWEKQYQRQLGVYRWLLENNGFAVETTGYLVYANASKAADAFDDNLTFETTLISCPTKVDWIEPTLDRIKATLDSGDIPPSGEACEYCPYRESAGKKLMSLHLKAKKGKIK